MHCNVRLKIFEKTIDKLYTIAYTINTRQPTTSKQRTAK